VVSAEGWQEKRDFFAVHDNSLDDALPGLVREGDLGVVARQFYLHRPSYVDDKGFSTQKSHFVLNIDHRIKLPLLLDKKTSRRP
jgi:hypothetical protein